MLKTVQSLINSGKGDTKRLNDILNTLKQGTPLYLSDFRYIESLTGVQQTNQETPQSKKERLVKEIKNEASILNQKRIQTEQSEPATRSTKEALSIIKTRLANGEITIEEFRAIKKALQGI